VDLIQQRFAPPPSANLRSPSYTPPEEAENGGAAQSAPILSPNSTDLLQSTQFITAATSNTVGSTCPGTAQINMTPSDMQSRHLFHREEQHLIYLQRPPPPSPLKTEEGSRIQSLN